MNHQDTKITKDNNIDCCCDHNTNAVFVFLGVLGVLVVKGAQRGGA
jgi:hypothetical protein